VVQPHRCNLRQANCERLAVFCLKRVITRRLTLSVPEPRNVRTQPQRLLKVLAWRSGTVCPSLQCPNPGEA
jgi:hypothetical protein